MFLCCCCPPTAEENPLLPPPTTADEPPAPPASAIPGVKPLAVDDEPSFTVLSDDELAAIIGQDENGAAPAATNGVATAADTVDKKKEGHDWDCNMTEMAVITLPEGHPDGDPVKVNEYVLEGHLGAGSFGNVKKARREVGSPPFQKYAIKMMSRHRLRRFKSSVVAGADGRMVVKTGVDMVNNEIKVMRNLYHRNVVLLFEVINDPSEDSIFMVMEYLEGGPSMDYDKDTKRFTSALTGGVLPSALASKLFFGLVSGLQYLHSKRVCHRDIKPENLLLTDGTKLRIMDFGCALVVEEDEDPTDPESEQGKLVDTSGTYFFLGPECCSGEPYSPWAADVWAVAVTLYCFLYGRLPFSKDGLGNLFEQIQQEEVPLPTAEAQREEGLETIVVLEPPVEEVLRGVFIKDPTQRWTLERIRAHPWLDIPRREDEEEDRRREEAMAQEAQKEKDEKK